MPKISLHDNDGFHLNVLDVDGFYLPDFGYECQERDFRMMVDSWQARDDDVIICNYTKSGTHWVWEIMNMLYKEKAEYVDSLKDETMIECIPKEKFDSLPSPRVLNSHIYFSMLPNDFIRRKCKIVYTIRNPKDVAVSFYHHHRNLKMYEYTGPWDSYLNRFLKGDVDYNSWFDHTHHWLSQIEKNKDYPIHIIHYENLQKNYIEEIKKLARFLNIQIADSLINNIGDKCKFENMKADKLQDLEDWRENSEGMYRRGVVGDWKNYFSLEQNRHFDEIYHDKMKDFNLKLQFSL